MPGGRGTGGAGGGVGSPGSPADKDHYAADTALEKPILASRPDRGKPHGQGTRRGFGIGCRGCTRSRNWVVAVRGGAGAVNAVLGAVGRSGGRFGRRRAVWGAVRNQADAVAGAVFGPRGVRLGGSGRKAGISALLSGKNERLRPRRTHTKLEWSLAGAHHVVGRTDLRPGPRGSPARRSEWSRLVLPFMDAPLLASLRPQCRRQAPAAVRPGGGVDEVGAHVSHPLVDDARGRGHGCGCESLPAHRHVAGSGWARRSRPALGNVDDLVVVAGVCRQQPRPAHAVERGSLAAVHARRPHGRASGQAPVGQVRQLVGAVVAGEFGEGVKPGGGRGPLDE